MRAPAREHAQALGRIEEALAVLSPPMHLLARMTTAQHALAVSLAQMRVPSNFQGSGADSRRDLVSLVASALSVLPQLHAHAPLRHQLLSILGAQLSM